MCLHTSLEWKVRDCTQIKTLHSICNYFYTVLIPMCIFQKHSLLKHTQIIKEMAPHPVSQFTDSALCYYEAFFLPRY